MDVNSAIFGMILAGIVIGVVTHLKKQKRVPAKVLKMRKK